MVSKFVHHGSREEAAKYWQGGGPSLDDEELRQRRNRQYRNQRLGIAAVVGSVVLTLVTIHFSFNDKAHMQAQEITCSDCPTEENGDNMDNGLAKTPEINGPL